MNWFIYANAVMWLGLGGYIFFVGRAQRRLEQRLAQLESPHE